MKRFTPLLCFGHTLFLAYKHWSKIQKCEWGLRLSVMWILPPVYMSIRCKCVYIGVSIYSHHKINLFLLKLLSLYDQIRYLFYCRRCVLNNIDFLYNLLDYIWDIIVPPSTVIYLLLFSAIPPV